MSVVISSYRQIFYSINKRTYAMNVYKVCESIQCHEISNKIGDIISLCWCMYYFERACLYFETNKIGRGLSFLWHLPWDILTLCYFWKTIQPSPTNQFKILPFSYFLVHLNVLRAALPSFSHFIQMSSVNGCLCCAPFGRYGIPLDRPPLKGFVRFP